MRAFADSGRRRCGVRRAARPPAPRAPTAFSTPSRNISCVYFAPTLRCDIRNGLSPKAPRPAGCPSYTDWGQGLTLGPKSAGVVCAGDTALGAPNVLAYGKTWHRGSITCTSRATGLTCRNARRPRLLPQPRVLATLLALGRQVPSPAPIDVSEPPLHV